MFTRLHFGLSLCPSCLPVFLSWCFPVRIGCVSACLWCLTFSMRGCLPLCLPACLPVSMRSCLPLCLSACLPVFMSVSGGGHDLHRDLFSTSSVSSMEFSCLWFFLTFANFSHSARDILAPLGICFKSSERRPTSAFLPSWAKMGEICQSGQVTRPLGGGGGGRTVNSCQTAGNSCPW